MTRWQDDKVILQLGSSACHPLTLAPCQVPTGYPHTISSSTCPRLRPSQLILRLAYTTDVLTACAAYSSRESGVYELLSITYTPRSISVSNNCASRRWSAGPNACPV